MNKGVAAYGVLITTLLVVIGVVFWFTPEMSPIPSSSQPELGDTLPSLRDSQLLRGIWKAEPTDILVNYPYNSLATTVIIAGIVAGTILMIVSDFLDKEQQT